MGRMFSNAESSVAFAMPSQFNNRQTLHLRYLRAIYRPIA